MMDSKSKLPRSTNTILKKRGACILKKARELSVLCDIRVCAIIAHPNGKFHTWPENHTEAVDLLKKFKNVEKKKSHDVNAIVGKGQTEERNTMKKMKRLDFSCFDDKLIDGLSRDSVNEISKLLNSKIEAARKRAEFLKKNMTVRDEGFQHFNASLNFDPNLFNPSEMMINFPPFQSNLPSSIVVSDSYFGQEQLGAIGLGNKWNFNFEPGFILDFPPPLSYSPAPRSYSPSVDNYCSEIRVPEIILDYPPSLTYSGVDNGCSTSDCYFGSEIALSGSTYTESASPFEVVGLLQHSPIEEDMFNPASMATIPQQPVQLLDYRFYSDVDNGCPSIRVPADCYFGSERASSGSTYTENASPLDQEVGLLQHSAASAEDKLTDYCFYY